MCFSAPASFIAATALSATGVATLRKTERASEIPFAAIPLLFGIQQAVEGFVWLSLGDAATASNTGTIYGYLFFAYLLWPSFMPFAVRCLESVPWRRRALGAFQAVGLGVSAYYLHFMITSPVEAHVANRCIAYAAPSNHIALAVTFYILTTCFSCLFSEHRLVNAFGAFGLLSLGIAYRFYATNLVSVWCFFAAVLSLIVYAHFAFRRKGPAEHPRRVAAMSS